MCIEYMYSPVGLVLCQHKMMGETYFACLCMSCGLRILL